MIKRLKVALICRFPQTKTWYTYNLANALLQQKIEVLLYGPKNNAKDKYVPVWRPLTYPLDITYKSIKDRIDIVHIQFEFVTFGFLPSIFLPFLLLLLKLTRKTVFVTIHGPLFSSEPPLDITKKLLSYRMFIPPFIIKIFIVLYYILFGKLSSAILVHSKFFKKWLNNYGIKNCYVIPHGIKKYSLNEKDRVPYRFRHFIKNSYLLFFGVLSPRKGLENLITAYAYLKEKKLCKDLRLVIAGEIPPYYNNYKNTLAKLCKELNVTEIVHFIGYVKDEEIESLFTNAMALILPYPYSLSASGPLALAIEYKTPVIATSTPYFREVLGDDYELLVKPNDIYELSEAILKILNNHQLREIICMRFYEKAKIFSWQNIAEQLIKLYYLINYRKTK